MSEDAIAHPRVVLGVGGGIAAYKACSLLRLLTESGCDVTVVPTPAALKFVGEVTWAALSGHEVPTELWRTAHDVPHVRLGQEADLVVVAPATADLIARAAHGQADDLLTNILLTARCPVVMAPAMHTEMWEHPATQANVRTLRERGVRIVDPAVGRLTGADSGAGRLAEPADIHAACQPFLSGRHDLDGLHVVVTAGGTREPIDPVRFLGNRSSGLQGLALADAAVARGARVTLVAANLERPAPSGVAVVPVVTALEMQEAVDKLARECDVVVMAAAVADFRPAEQRDTKIKKGDDAPESIALVPNPDILAGLVAQRTDQVPVIVGFAAETGDERMSVLGHAREKLARKGCDLLVVNDVSSGQAFGQPDNAVTILDRRGSEIDVPRASKRVIADAVWDAVVSHLRR